MVQESLQNSARRSPVSATALTTRLAHFARPIVALSGGLDSSLLALLCFEAVGDRMLAATAESPSLSPRDRASVIDWVSRFGIPHAFVRSGEFADDRYLANDLQRCYFCKSHLFSRLGELAKERGMKEILFGAQADDLGDYRPGHRAAEEYSVHAPFIDAGWGKAEITAEAARRGLEIADRPASPCLASRLAYGVRVTEERLERIARAEAVLATLGMRIFRVRDRGDEATIELGEAEEAMPFDRVAVLKEMMALGFDRVSFDPRGYRRGAMNEGKIA